MWTHTQYTFIQKIVLHSRQDRVSSSVAQEKAYYQILCIYFKGLKCKKSPVSKNFSLGEVMTKMGRLITFTVGIGGDLDQKKWNYDKGPL